MPTLNRLQRWAPQPATIAVNRAHLESAGGRRAVGGRRLAEEGFEAASAGVERAFYLEEFLGDVAALVIGVFVGQGGDARGEIAQR